jgi:hypothetical protein
MPARREHLAAASAPRELGRGAKRSLANFRSALARISTRDALSSATLAGKVRIELSLARALESKTPSFLRRFQGRMAKLADAQDLKSCGG